jgi:nicotinamidase-related amidase
VIYIAGQARNFCVATSLKQLLNKAPQLAEKIIILDDCMSDVPGFDGISDAVWEKAKNLGVRFSTTTTEIVSNLN